MKTKLLFYKHTPHFLGEQWNFRFYMNRMEYDLKYKIFLKAYQTSFSEKEFKESYTPKEVRVYKSAIILTTCGKRKTLFYV